MVILHLVIQKRISTPGIAVSIFVNKFAYIPYPVGKYYSCKSERNYFFWSCATENLHRLLQGSQNGLQHFGGLKKFPGMYCLTIATLHGVPTYSSLFLNVEVDWLDEQPELREGGTLILAAVSCDTLC